jgi:hypothetical protein
LACVKDIANFEVKEIMDEKEPYSTLLRISLAFDNYVFIDLKKETKTFEANATIVVQPLDPYLGP